MRVVLLALLAALTFCTPRVACAHDGVWSRSVDFFSFRYDFLVYAATGGVLVGMTCGLLGTFMVLRRLSLMGDALGHAALPGVGIAFLITQTKSTGPILVGATTTALLAAMTIGFIGRNSRTYPDAALGMVLASFFGLGVVVLSYVQNTASASKSGLTDFLFGNAAAITPDELFLLGAILCVSLIVIVALYRPLKLMSFDSDLAQAMGLPIRWLHYGMMALVALTIVASIQSVGVVLVAAMLITPASAAYLLTDRLHFMIALSVFFGGLSGFLGTLLSFLFAGFSSGPSMVVVASIIFMLAFFFAPERGQVAQALKKKRQRTAAARGR
jgi:manganese/zinc/iron transport system permease protein